MIMGISYFLKKKEDEDEDGAVRAAAENAGKENENKARLKREEEERKNAGNADSVNIKDATNGRPWSQKEMAEVLRNGANEE